MTSPMSSHHFICLSTEVPFFTMESTGGGWDVNDWGSPSKPATGTAAQSDTSSSSRQEMMQKRREERRLKQQAAREKRSAGISLAPSSGLGVTKKNFQWYSFHFDSPP